MNDENFDRIFGDKLKAGKDFPFTEAKWQKMEGRLDSYLSERRQKRRWVLILLPLLALVGLVGKCGWVLHEAQRNIQDLTAEVKALRLEKQSLNFDPSVSKTNAAPKSITKTDTMYHRIVIKRYDTVYQTIVVRRELSDIDQNQQGDLMGAIKGTAETTTSERELKSESTINDKAKGGENVPPLPALVENTPVNAVNNDSKTANNADLTEKDNIKEGLKSIGADLVQTNNEKKSDVAAKVDSLSIKTENPIETAETKKNDKDDLQKKKVMPIIKPIRKPKYEIGISSGLVILDGQNILKQKGYSVAGRGGILLNDHLKIVAEAQYLTLNYEIDKISESNDVPTINPPTKNYVLKQVNVEQPYWHYAFGLEYSVGHKWLKPFVGLSVFGQTKLEEKFQYQFQSLRRRSDVFVYKDRNEDTFLTPFLRLRTGAECPIYRKIKAQAESSYDIKIRDAPQFQKLWQLKGSVLYRF